MVKVGIVLVRVGTLVVGGCVVVVDDIGLLLLQIVLAYTDVLEKVFPTLSVDTFRASSEYRRANRALV